MDTKTLLILVAYGLSAYGLGEFIGYRLKGHYKGIFAKKVMTIEKLNRASKTFIDELDYDNTTGVYTAKKESSGCGSLDGYDLAQKIDAIKGVNVINYYDMENPKIGDDMAVVQFKLSK